MKKISALILVFLLVAASVSTLVVNVSAENADNREFTVYRVETAPTIDGVIEEGEYPLLTSWPDDQQMSNRGDYVNNISAYIYMCYDEDYLYYAVKTECDSPHVAMMDNDAKHWVFNAHHLMTLIIPDDPTNGIYPDGSAGWADLYNGGFCYEWTMIYTSEATPSHGEGEAFATDHFGNLIAGNLATYACGSDGDYDMYEIKIPWSSMKSSKQTTPLIGEEGTVFGIDLTIGLTDINNDADVIANGGYDGGDGVYKGNYLYLADCYAHGPKTLNACAVMTLGDLYQDTIVDESSEPAEETSEPAAETSEPAEESSSKDPTPPTGDSGFAALAILTVVALAGIVIAKRK